MLPDYRPHTPIYGCAGRNRGARRNGRAALGRVARVKSAIPGLVSALAGVAVGGLLVLGLTTAIEQNKRPEIDRSGDSQSSLLNNVEYGTR